MRNDGAGDVASIPLTRISEAYTSGVYSARIGMRITSLLRFTSITSWLRMPPRSTDSSALTGVWYGLAARSWAVSPTAYSFLSATNWMRSLFSWRQGT